MEAEPAARRVPRRAPAARVARLAPPVWASWEDERLLDLRMCELGIQIPGSGLEEPLDALGRELEARGLRFRPHAWLSDEWFCPDGVGGIAIPFYLAHPRLVQLEEAQMLEAEGSTREWCLRILRHEAGHAIENAFGLRKRRDRQRAFGRTSVPYPQSYVARPYSKSFVRHLDAWYAQSHPDEDFAETFAVWLDPTSDWRRRYAGWVALDKLNFVDGLMAKLAGQEPPPYDRSEVQPLHRLRKTLRTHYRHRRRFYRIDHPHYFDRDLRRLFSAAPEHAQNEAAVAFLKRLRPEMRRRIARWTGVYQYTVDRVLQEMIGRCRELGLHLARPEEETRLEFAVLLSAQSLSWVAGGRHRVPL